MIRHSITLPVLPLEAAAPFRDAPVVFHTSFPEYDGKLPVIWICHALTANSDAEEWWPEMVGPGKPIDTQRNFVVCVNMLGSPYGTLSPATLRPDTLQPWRLDFPTLTIRDSVTVFRAVADALGIGTIDRLLGASNGGFHALEWAIEEPERFRRCFFIATAPRISPYVGATVETQRMALEADPSFRQGTDLRGGQAGLRCARAQALISYRCFEGYRIRQSEPDPDTLFAERVASYQRYQGEKFLRRFDAYSYYSLCNALDSHNVGRGRGGVAAALGRIRAAATVVAIDTDVIFPTLEARTWAPMIPGAEYIEISSSFGHDGFLLETARLSAILMK